jgi:hypothetical protein
MSATAPLIMKEPHMLKPQERKLERYYDIMRESLNRNYEQHIAPYWRSHQSMKGITLRII